MAIDITKRYTIQTQKYRPYSGSLVFIRALSFFYRHCFYLPCFYRPLIGTSLFSFLFITLMGSLPPESASGAAIKAPLMRLKPLKIQTCELLLKGSVDRLSHKDNLLPRIQTLRGRIQQARPKTRAVGTSYDDQFYEGSLYSLNLETAENLVQRLRGIEESLEKTNLDSQFITMELRGEEIEQAIPLLEKEEKTLAFEYKKLKGRIIPYLKSLSMGLTASLLNHAFFTTLDAVTEGALGSNAEVLELASIGFFSFVYFSAVELLPRAKGEAYDNSYFHLKKWLLKANDTMRSDQFYLSASHFKLPSEFHHYLMKKESLNFDQQPPIHPNYKDHYKPYDHSDPYQQFESISDLNGQTNEAPDRGSTEYQQQDVQENTPTQNKTGPNEAGTREAGQSDKVKRNKFQNQEVQNQVAQSEAIQSEGLRKKIALRTEELRRLALQTQEPPSSFESKMESYLKRSVQWAGETERDVLIDNILYFDTEDREPVWLFIYRAYRSSQPPKDPPKKEKHFLGSDPAPWEDQRLKPAFGS